MSIYFQGLTLSALAVALVACGPLPEGAAGPGYLAENGRVVVPLTEGGQFEVQSRSGDAGAQFFCAAGDYAYSRQGARPVDRLVLVAPVGPGVTTGGRSAIYNVVAGQTDDSPRRDGISIDMRKAGENMSVAQARSLCNGQPTRLF